MKKITFRERERSPCAENLLKKITRVYEGDE